MKTSQPASSSGIVPEAERLLDERYLTDAAKQRELRHWQEAQQRPRPDGDAGGHGYADPEMVPWCARLNALRGVCTLQSCAGHPSDTYALPGSIWLWCERPLLDVFWQYEAPGLASYAVIERVERRLQSYGREILDVQFYGQERGQLTTSMELIATALERTAERLYGR